MGLEELKKAKETIRKAKAKAKRIVKKTFKEEAEKLFSAHPVLKAISWKGYTPSFNDGDPCYFRSNHDYADAMLEGEDWQEEWCGNWYNEDSETSSEKKAAHAAVREFLGAFDDDDMEEMFGNGFRVTLHSDGTVEQEDYYD